MTIFAMVCLGVFILTSMVTLLPTTKAEQNEITYLDLEESEPCHIKYQQFPGHTMCLQRSPGARTVNMTEYWKDRIISAHNHWRSVVEPPATNMMRLRWDDELEMISRKWSEACDRRSNMEHDKLRFVPGGMFVGQNMASTTIDFTLAFEHWFQESNDYVFGVDYKEQMYNSKQCGYMIGHYTQLVWADTYLVGCAATTCYNRENVIVCNYGPAGNRLPFDHPYERGEQCSKCKNCTDGLCDCGDVFCHGGKLNPTTCQCDCKIKADGYAPDFLAEPDCHLKCKGSQDVEYCGEDHFNDCNNPWVSMKCPHMCRVCPYSEKGYKEKMRAIKKSAGRGDRIIKCSYTFNGTHLTNVSDENMPTSQNYTVISNGTVLTGNDTVIQNGTILTGNDTVIYNAVMLYGNDTVIYIGAMVNETCMFNSTHTLQEVMGIEIKPTFNTTDMAAGEEPDTAGVLESDNTPVIDLIS